MNNLNDEQREQLLRQIVETPAGERIRMKCGAADLRSIITDTLSLIDSKAAEGFAGPCAACGHNNYDAERGECKQRWMEGRYSVVCGCPCAKHNSLASAATQMRDKCVEKVRVALANARRCRVDNEDYHAGYRTALTLVIPVLQSLTLEEKQQS